MVTATRLRLSDISRQNRYQIPLDDEITPRHTVGQATEHYVQRMRIPGDGLRWGAFSRGVKLDNKATLDQLSEEDAEWMVMPEVSAG